MKDQKVKKKKAEPIEIMRIQKAFSTFGVMSRRATEQAILDRRITVNAKPATVGLRVDCGNDTILLDGKRVGFCAQKKLYVMLNKPRGYVSSLKDEHEKRFAVDLLNDIGARLYNVGRLDKNSEGLLLFTNDGNFANLVMHPKNKIIKVYKVTVSPKITEDQLVQLSSKFLLGKEELALIDVTVQKELIDRSTLLIKLSQGRNRQIRRMCEMVDLKVLRLKRIALGDLRLAALQVGQYRHLTEAEVAALCRAG
ncbi:MAG: rRNA pseudouridine synthase [Oscillospiraceae bacterium]|jgi:23S rRNA pseudouridine2605 synthase|nr:rRNA pseudouridine synthase [Oscillospiraceae bacterium]